MTGHSTLKEVDGYRRAANRKIVADPAFDKAAECSGKVLVSHPERLVKNG